MSFLSLIPLAKIIYTTILVGLIGLLAREVYNVWGDRSLYVGKFAYFADGKIDDGLSSAFPASVIAQHQLLRSALIEETRRREKDSHASAPATAEIYLGLPSGLAEVGRWQTALSDLELKIQGFDLGKLLAQLRTSVSPPDEINGFVEKSGTMVRASVSWPARPISGGVLVDSPFETGQLSGESSAALAIAASIVWAQAAGAEPGFAKVPRDTFVAWTLLWWELRMARARQSLGDPPSDDQKKRWQQTRVQAGKLLPQAARYPEVWRLHADIIDAAYDRPPTPEEAATALDDRKLYAAAVAPPPKAVAAASVSPVQQPATAHPGLAVWTRPAGGPADAPYNSRVTATAIVVDAGVPKILLPVFALQSAAGSNTEFSLNSTGPVIATANLNDALYYAGQASPGVVLAPLVANAAADNTLPGGARLTEYASPPASGSTVKLFSPGGLQIKPGGTEQTATVQGISEALLSTDRRVTQPGDAGAPVVDARGALIAMGYQGTGEVSQLLTIDWVFQRKKLELKK